MLRRVEEPAGVGDPQLAHHARERHAAPGLEVLRERRLGHVGQSSSRRETDVAREVLEDVAQAGFRRVTGGSVRGPAQPFARHHLVLVARGVGEEGKHPEQVAQLLDAMAVHAREDRLGGPPRRGPGEDQPPRRALQHVGHLGELGQVVRGPTDPIVAELDDGVAVDRHLAFGEVTDPVVRQIGSHQAHVAGGEGADVVAGDEAAPSLGDQVDLVFRVVAPPADLTGEVMGQDAHRRLRVWGDDLPSEVRVQRQARRQLPGGAGRPRLDGPVAVDGAGPIHEGRLLRRGCWSRLSHNGSRRRACAALREK